MAQARACRARSTPSPGAGDLVVTNSNSSSSLKGSTASYGGCFPSVGFRMPSSPPTSLDGWWCDMSTEYAFVGFSYEVTACQSLSQLKRDFADIRQQFQGRYVRIYGACGDAERNFYNDLINAAWSSGIGVHALIWFGFDGGSKWKSRRDDLFSVLKSNKYAKYVVRVVQFGSEPLFDSVMSPDALAQQVLSAKAELSDLQIPITVSDLAYGYQTNGGAPSVLKAIDFIDAHMLPFFSGKASTAKNAWPDVQNDLDWFVKNGLGKKIYLSQNGWPSTTYDGVEPTSNEAVANVQNEHDYYTLLDSHCSDLKSVPGGGVGWFAHLYSDAMEPGYGIYNDQGKLKFAFSPRISC